MFTKLYLTGLIEDFIVSTAAGHKQCFLHVCVRVHESPEVSQLCVTGSFLSISEVIRHPAEEKKKKESCQLPFSYFSFVCSSPGQADTDSRSSTTKQTTRCTIYVKVVSKCQESNSGEKQLFSERFVSAASEATRALKAAEKLREDCV